MAADRHNDVPFARLLGFADENKLEEVAWFVAVERRAGPLVGLVKAALCAGGSSAPESRRPDG